MSKQKIENSIRVLDEGITDCENYLAKVLSRKIEEPRHIIKNKKKNEATTKQDSREPSLTRRAASTSRINKPTKSATVNKRTNHSPSTTRKQAPSALESQAKATWKSADGIHKQCSCTKQGPVTTYKCEAEKPDKQSPSKKQVHHLYLPPVSVKPNGKEEKSRSKSPVKSIKHLSWGEVLQESSKERKQQQQQPDKKACQIHGITVWNSEPIASSDVVSSTAQGSRQFFQYPDSRHFPTDVSSSSRASSGFSSNSESYYSDKSIQCGSPVTSNTVVKSARSSSSVSSHSSAVSKGKDAQIQIGVLASDAFNVIDPVRTLDFLVKELQGLLQKTTKDDDSVNRIVVDMEKVLHRLLEIRETVESTNPGRNLQQVRQDVLSSSASNQSFEATPVQDTGPSQPAEVSADKVAVVKTLEKVPFLTQLMDANTASLQKKIQDAKTRIMPPETTQPVVAPVTSEENAFLLHKQLDTSCKKLETMCQAMERTCDELRVQRDKLEEEVHTKMKELETTTDREQDYITAISTLRSNLESATRRVNQLSVENSVLQEQVKLIPFFKAMQEKLKFVVTENERLREENKGLPTLKEIEKTYRDTLEENKKLQEEINVLIGVKEAKKKLSIELEDVLESRNSLQKELQMLKMEREKLLVLKESKDKELTNFQKEIVDIKQLVAEQLDAMKNSLKDNKVQNIPSVTSDQYSSYSDVDCTITDRTHKRPICSSPTSSQSSVVEVDRSWKEITPIYPTYGRSAPELLVTMAPRPIIESETSEFKSLERDSWHDPPEVGQGCFMEDTPPRPQTATAGHRPQTATTCPRPPPKKEATSDQRGTATEELHENMKELFQLMSKTSSMVLPAVSATSSHISCSQTTGRTCSFRGFEIEIPVLPSPPLPLKFPSLSDISQLSGSLLETSSVDSIDVFLQDITRNKKE